MKRKNASNLISALKMVVAWIVIAAMLVDAPLTLYASAQQSGLRLTAEVGGSTIPDIGNYDQLQSQRSSAQTEFFGPDIEHLEERLLELEMEWHAINQELLTIDEALVEIRESGREHSRRVREAEGRLGSSRQNAESRRNRGGIIDAEPFEQPIASDLSNLSNSLEAYRSTARSAQARQEQHEASRESIFAALLAIETEINIVHEEINNAWYEFDLLHGACEYGDYYVENDGLMCAACEALDYFPEDHDCASLYDADELAEEYYDDDDYYYYNDEDDYYYYDEDDDDEYERDYSGYIDEYGNFWYGLDREYYSLLAQAFESVAIAPLSAPTAEADVLAAISRGSDAPFISPGTVTTADAPAIIAAGYIIPIRSVAQLQAFINGSEANVTITLPDGSGSVTGPLFGQAFNGAHFRLEPTIGSGVTGTVAAAVYTINLETQGRPGTFTGIFDGNGHVIAGLRLRSPATGHLPSIGFVREAGHGAVIRNVTFRNTISDDGSGAGDSGNQVGRAFQDGTAATGPGGAAAWLALPVGVGTIVGRTVPTTSEYNSVISLYNVRLDSTGTGNVFQMALRGAINAGLRNNLRMGTMVGQVGDGTNLYVRNASTAHVHMTTPNAGTGIIGIGGGLVGAVVGGTVNIGATENVTNSLNTQFSGRGDVSTRGVYVGGGVVGRVFSGDVFISDTTTAGWSQTIRAMGGIVGLADTGSSVHLNNVTNTADFSSRVSHTSGNPDAGIVGGLIGRSLGHTVIADSTNAGHVSHAVSGTGAARVGGIIGESRGGLTITYTHNRGWVNKTTADDNAGTSIGGIVGRVHPVAGQPISLSNVTNTANVRSGTAGNGAVGGIIGEIMPSFGAPVPTITLTDVRNAPGAASGQGIQGVSGGRHSGGIIGFIRTSGVTIQNFLPYNANSANVVASTRNAVAGGMVGRASGANLTIIDARENGVAATNTGNVTANVRDGNAGGIVGRVENVNASIIGASNSGTVSSGAENARSSSSSGGIVGNITASGNGAEIEGVGNGAVSNTGAITARGRSSVAGGIVGRLSARNVIITDVINDSNVTAGGPSEATAGARRRGRDGIAGGIVGVVLANAHNLEINGAETFANRSIVALANGGHSGGIIGSTAGRDLTITDATNRSHVGRPVTGIGSSVNAGGIIGRMTSAARDASLTNVNNYGAITATRGRPHSGGIVGLASAMNLTISHANNRGIISVSGRSDAGGIIGASTAANARLEVVRNYENVRFEGSPRTFTFAGGIVGRSTGRSLNISNAYNEGQVGRSTAVNTPAGNASRRSGGIVGEFSGAGANITNVYNFGIIIAHSSSNSGAGGIVGIGRGSSAVIESARNSGAVSNSASRPAGGIVGHQRNSNFVIRNSFNEGPITTGSGTDRRLGAGGIIGRSEGANTRVEISFNRGTIVGGVATGGIIGRTQGTVVIQNFYNIGTVDGGVNWAGHGIIGRQQDTARITINSGFVSARVRGFATLVRVAGTGAAGIGNRPHNNTHLTHVYVDESAFISISSTTLGELNTARNQTNGNGRATPILVDTEFLTAGFLPGLSTGPWRSGVIDRDTGELICSDIMRTYPYFHWQIPNGELEEQFFHTIRIPCGDGDNLLVPAMDNVRNSRGLNIQNNFIDPSTDTSLFVEGTREFLTYNETLHLRALPLDTVDMYVSISDPWMLLPHPVSAGLVSPNGVVGFETRDFAFRLIIRGYNNRLGVGAWIDHADIRIISDCDIPYYRINRREGDIPGIFVIEFGYVGGQGIDVNLGELTVELSAHGFRTTERIIIRGDIQGEIGPNMIKEHFINVPMFPVPFPIRVWVLEAPTDMGDEFEGNQPLGTPIENAWLNHDWSPNQGVILINELDPPRTASPSRRPENELYGYFIIQAMWGDNITGGAPLFGSYTHRNLQFNDLFLPDPSAGEREPHPPMYDYEGRLVEVLDLHIYLEDFALPRMQFHFYEDSDRDASFDLNFVTSFTVDDVLPAWYWIPESQFEIRIHDDGGAAPPSVSQLREHTAPLENGNTTGNNFRVSPSKGMSIEGRNSSVLWASNADRPYIREGTPGTIVNVVAATGSGGLGTGTSAQTTVRNLLEMEGTFLQGSNPFRWVGADSGEEGRVHMGTTFDIICRTGRFYNRYGLSMEQFIEYNEPDGDSEAADSGDDSPTIAPRINIGMVPRTEGPPCDYDSFTLTFNLYINNETHYALYNYFISSGATYANESSGFRSITVEVVPGQEVILPQSVLSIGNIYATETTAGHAFWGWFDDETLNPARTGRALNQTTGLRRPALADRCLVDYSDLFERIAAADTDVAVVELFGSVEGGNIDLFAIWSLWGDVDDNDEVDGTDVLLMDQYLFDRFMVMIGGEPYFDVPLNTRAGRVTTGPELTGDDVLRVDEYLFDRFMVMIGGEPYFGAILGRP